MIRNRMFLKIELQASLSTTEPKIDTPYRKNSLKKAETTIYTAGTQLVFMCHFLVFMHIGLIYIRYFFIHSQVCATEAH
jgi:hypothetical protein